MKSFTKSSATQDKKEPGRLSSNVTSNMHQETQPWHHFNICLNYSNSFEPEPLSIEVMPYEIN